MENFNKKTLKKAIISFLGDEKEYYLGFVKTQKDFLQHHFAYQITKKEGGAFSYDKAGFIVDGLELFFKTGVEITFDYSQKRTYQLPKEIFTTHNEIVSFFEVLVSLFAGNPTSYLVWLKDNLLPTT